MNKDFFLHKPVIGMIHLTALPGAPLALANALTLALERALIDADALVTGGCQALMMENFGDTPFYPGRVSPTVVAAMTRIAVEIRRRFNVPLGINVLRNDGLAALAVAAAAGANFIRVNVLTGARLTDQGIIQGIAPKLLRERAALNAQQVLLLADVDVKHSVALAPRSLADEVKDTLYRGLADGLIVSGSATGAAVDSDHLASVKRLAGAFPVLVGSGVSGTSIAQLKHHADGFIVGTWLKKHGQVGECVDLQRVKELMEHYQKASL